jgi:hypothetical protein
MNDRALNAEQGQLELEAKRKTGVFFVQQIATLGVRFCAFLQQVHEAP